MLKKLLTGAIANIIDDKLNDLQKTVLKEIVKVVDKK